MRSFPGEDLPTILKPVPARVRAGDRQKDVNVDGHRRFTSTVLVLIKVKELQIIAGIMRGRHRSFMLFICRVY